MIVKTTYKEICQARQTLLLEEYNLKLTIDKYKKELKTVREKMTENDDYLINEIKFD